MKNIQAMMMKKITALLISVFLCSQVFAHTKLKSSSPENGSILDRLPTAILLSFSKTIRLTKVTLSKTGDKPVKLKLDKSKKFQTNFSFPLELVEMSDQSGEYSVEWRGIGQDGHIMKGVFTYTVK